jgi:ferrous iron transport protein B
MHQRLSSPLPARTTPATASTPVTVALVGNPNTGKTTLFNVLAGMRQHVGNYPGVTVETKKGRMIYQGRPIDLVDLPGTYSLAPRSPDEMVAVDLILGQQSGEPKPDVVIAIVDAANLERNLYLTTQAMELGVPLVVALNMIDVAEQQGIRIDAEGLARQLGVPVAPIQANRGKGLDRLKEIVAQVAHDHCPLPPHTPQRVPFPEAFEREVSALQAELGQDACPYLTRRLLLDIGGYTEERLVRRHGEIIRAHVRAARERLAGAGCPIPAVEARARYSWIRQATAGCVERPAQRPVTWTDRFDRVLTHKVWGTLVFLMLMFVVFQAIFTWARPLMDLIDQGKSTLADGLSGHLPRGPLASLLKGGVLEGVGSVVIFLPQILILFAFIAVLEDCGYMARAAFLMDRLMARCGLSGKSFIPMLSSVACAVPGIMATRVIENRRDRLATILVAPLMSCSARLPVYILLIGAFLTEGQAWWVPGVTMFGMYALGLTAAPLAALLLKRTLLRGETPVFVMEMPLYRWPSPRTVLRRMADSGWAFLRRAGTIILASMVVIWALLYFPNHNAAGESYEELIARAEEAIEAPMKEREQLEQSIAPQRQELDLIERRLKAKGIGYLYGLLGPSQPEREALEGRRAALLAEVEPIAERQTPLQAAIQRGQVDIHALQAEWTERSCLGQMGHAIEPVVRPLGWDWKIGTAALASFPAREVVVGTLGIIYNLGKEVDAGSIEEAEDPGETELGRTLRTRWAEDVEHPVAVALSLMVFFALCCQCASTLAVIRRETNSWRWPAFTFVYMTVLAYLGALIVYQVGSLL